MGVGSVMEKTNFNQTTFIGQALKVDVGKLRTVKGRSAKKKTPQFKRNQIVRIMNGIIPHTDTVKVVQTYTKDGKMMASVMLRKFQDPTKAIYQVPCDVLIPDEKLLK